MLFYDQMNVGNLIFDSSTVSKSSLNVCKFLVHVLLKPSLENFEHFFASLWEEYNCAVVWAFFGTAFLWDWNENWPFPVPGHCWVFQICWYTECSPFTATSFSIWNSSTEIPFCLFILFMGFSRQEYWNGLTFPSPVDHILSDLSTLTCLSWVAPQGMA